MGLALAHLFFVITVIIVIIVVAILVVLPFLVFVMEVALHTLRAVIVRGALGALLPTGTEGEQDRKKPEGVELHLGISFL